MEIELDVGQSISVYQDRVDVIFLEQGFVPNLGQIVGQTNRRSAEDTISGLVAVVMEQSGWMSFDDLPEGSRLCFFFSPGDDQSIFVEFGRHVDLTKLSVRSVTLDGNLVFSTVLTSLVAGNCNAVIDLPDRVDELLQDGSVERAGDGITLETAPVRVLPIDLSAR